MTLFDDLGDGHDRKVDVGAANSPTWTARQLLWLMSHRSIGPTRAVRIARSIPDPDEFQEAWPEVSEQLGRVFSSVPAEVVGKYSGFDNFDVVGIFDDEYPPLLATIPNAPPVLWLRGSLSIGRRNVAIVGTRNPSDFGQKTASLAAECCVENGFGVVSGLALGVDSVAHLSTLDAGGYTIAVLAGSLGNPQPRSNRVLADRILESGGALVCEVLPSESPSAGTLVARNRLQSGLSIATVIAESGIPGGTLHTARFTLEQGRKLVVPMPLGRRVDGPSLAGNVALTDPEGMDAEVVRATGPLAAAIEKRRPAADFAPTTPAELWDVLGSL